MFKTVIILVALCLSAVLGDEHNHSVSFRRKIPVVNHQTSDPKPGLHFCYNFVMLIRERGFNSDKRLYMFPLMIPTVSMLL